MNVKKTVRNLLLGIIGVLLLILVALQVVLRPKVLTLIVNRLAAEYVDGDVAFSRIKASVIKSFPYLNVTADDFALTYPHDKFARYDSLYTEKGRFSLLNAGREATTDTLASFRRLEVSLNYMDLLKGSYDIRNASLSHPRIFAHYYDSTAANWDILPLGGDKDTTEAAPLPPVTVHQVRLSDRPFIVFTDPADTLHALVTLRELSAGGALAGDLFDSRIDLRADSLFLSGRLPADTLALGLDLLEVKAARRNFSLSAQAKAFLATGSFGRLRIPVGLRAEGSLPKRKDNLTEVLVDRLGLDVATLSLQGNGDVVLYPDKTYIKADAAIDKTRLSDLVDTFGDNFPVLKKVSTDAVLSLDAHCDGYLADGSLPEVDAHLVVPESRLDYEGLGRSGRVSLDATAATDRDLKLDVDLDKLFIDIYGARINLTGSAADLLGEDPDLGLDGTVHARVDSLTQAFTADLGIRGTGLVDARLHGKARLSQLDMSRIGGADVRCSLTARDLHVEDAPDSVLAYIRKADITLATQGNRIDDNIRRGARILALEAAIDTLNVTYCDDIYIRGGDVKLLAQNSADILKGGKGLTPLMGVLQVGRLQLRDNDGLAVGLRENEETFRIHPATKALPTPKFNLTSQSGNVRVRTGEQALFLRDLAFDVSANRHQRAVSARRDRKHVRDSLQRAYPGARNRDDDFASSDIDISLSKALAQYVRDWDFSGNLALENGRVILPSFPLRNTVSGVAGSFTNDEVRLRNITLRSGASDISAEATVSGLRRALIRKGLIRLDAAVRSEFIDANELLRAYAYYTTYESPGLENASESELEEAVDLSELPDSTGNNLIVIPKNIVANLLIEASGIKYDSLLVNWAAADIAMRDRTVQVTNALAASNMGDIYFEGFYSTRSKEDIKAGFDLSLVDITAEKVITLIPAVDSIIPMLKSFGGDLDCELAATTDLDTCMNVVLPTIDGVMRISGENLRLQDSEEFTKIAKLLLFKNKKKAVVDKMSVTGTIRDNTLEVFPFVLSVDRYKLAASGIHHLDESFRYHISVIKSPLLVKFGINAWGEDFDHVKFGVGKAKYKSVHVPVYTKQLDTIQYSLVASIHNIFELGVEKAIAENNSQRIPQVRLEEDTGPEEEGAEDALEASLGNVQDLLENVTESVGSRREALRQEILRLEEEAAEERKKRE